MICIPNKDFTSNHLSFMASFMADILDHTDFTIQNGIVINHRSKDKKE